MRPRALLALGIPLACAALFVRLGVWQLSRLQDRRAFNAVLAERLASASTDIMRLPADTALGHYRRVSASGAMLYDREVAYAGRTHEGSPGVDFLTPMRTADRDTVVMVNRGWAYSADAASIDATRWREKDSAKVSGFAETFAGTERGNSSATSRRVHALDRAAIQLLVGLPVAPYVLVETSDSASRTDSVPVRLVLPKLDEGPHQSYAFQWFGFAIVAVVGGVVLSRRSH